MADIDLPVFSFRANWKEGVTERLSFLTDVMRAAKGAEQRRSLRSTPRRGLEADFLLTGPERAFWDLYMNRLSAEEITIPLYWDIVSLTSATVGGATDRIDFDNTKREFAVGLALLSGTSALSSEVVEIVSMDAGGIDLANPTVGAWPRGTKLMPLRRGIIEDVGSPSHHTAGVATVSAQFKLTAPNPWTPEADGSPVYLDLPVFLHEPNWVDALAVDYERSISRLDTDLGLPYQVDSLGRSLVGQSHRWFLPGRENLAGFRDLLYRHRGRAGAFWLPTFKHDLRLVNSPGSGATQIEVQNVGYGYTGGPTSGREYIAIKHGAGTILRKVTSVVPGSTAATEKLNLDAPLGLDLSPSLARRISFADVARFDQDDFELIHHAGLDGLTEANAVFRTFKNTRTAPAPINYPIPITAMNTDPCGDDAGECYAVTPPEEEWTFKIRYVVLFPGPSTGTGQCNISVSPSFGAGAVGIFLSSASRPVAKTLQNADDGAGNLILEYTFYGITVPTGGEWTMSTQHGSGTVPSTSRGRFDYRRPEDSDFTPIQCDSGYGVVPGNPVFDIQGLWPNTRKFTLTG